MLGQRAEAEVATSSADISMLTNEFNNMCLMAAEERAEILEELRKGRNSAPPSSPWVASQAAAEYAAARQKQQQQIQQQQTLHHGDGPSTPRRKKKRYEQERAPIKSSKGVDNNRRVQDSREAKKKSREKDREAAQIDPMQVGELGTTKAQQVWAKNGWHADAGWAGSKNGWRTHEDEKKTTSDEFRQEGAADPCEQKDPWQDNATLPNGHDDTGRRVAWQLKKTVLDSAAAAPAPGST